VESSLPTGAPNSEEPTPAKTVHSDRRLGHSETGRIVVEKVKILP
jgi:hypothetical protein